MAGHKINLGSNIERIFTKSTRHVASIRLLHLHTQMIHSDWIVVRRRLLNKPFWYRLYTPYLINEISNELFIYLDRPDLTYTNMFLHYKVKIFPYIPW